MYCVVGLGNPGESYSQTRHNIGFRVADALAGDLDTDIRRRRYLALTAIGRIGRSEVLVMKPRTFMNLSGSSVRAACHALGIPVHNLIVVYDDVDLPVARLRLRRGGGPGGHRGVESVIEEMQSSEFARVRIGIGRPPRGMETADYVLEPFAAEEEGKIEDAIARAVEAIEAIVTRGIEQAMQTFNVAPE